MILYIIFGIPGSGKTTLANKISNGRIPIYEADMFFMRNGKYEWNPKQLGIAHKWCFNNVENELKKGNDVIVSNTSLLKRDRKQYIDLGKKYNAEIKVIKCEGNYQNLHNVPNETIEKMKKKLEDFSIDELK